MRSRHNNIGNEGTQKFAKILPINCTLKILDLENNEMGYSRIKALNEAVGESTSIIVIKIYDEEISLLQKQLATNKKAFDDINNTLPSSQPQSLEKSLDP